MANKFSVGREQEIKVLNGLIKRNFDANLYLCYDSEGDEESQTIEISDGFFLRCPDIEVYENRSLNIHLMRVEVKSFKYPYTNSTGKLGSRISEEIDFVTIKKVQLDDYLSLQSYEEIECRVVFVIRRGENKGVYWNTLDNLLNTKHVIGDAYGDGFEHYVWRLKDMIIGLDSF